MNTSDLIDRLVQEAEPVPQAAVGRRLALGVGAGAVVSAALMLASVGPRPDLMPAMGTASFWTKFAYTLLLALTGLHAVGRLARPAGRARSGRWLAGLIVAAIGTIALAELGMSRERAWMPMVMGHSASWCPWIVLALGLPILAGGSWAVRGLAPTRLGLAGAATGLMAGALAAWIYSFSCTETAMPFLAIWYTLGIVAVGVVGGLLGPRLLRW
ncbi:NrsF family protein [Marinivivus vitaminiproducens]|uniref:NrsF family protein n=1 Tax=Marinivivus vitaminiproducens TaxID=3035935 RepID=UPI0027A01E6B|nr:DUF1109 domain-containing protein [Geminicoccaceae bacterium SCSIO 64248]